MILFDAVSKSFGGKEKAVIDAIKEMSLYIPRGTVVGLIGPSGAGKTTFLKLICGLLKADSGRVRVFQKDPVRHRRYLAENLSVLFADSRLLQEEETVEQNMYLIKASYKIKENEFVERLHYLFHMMGLEPWKDTRVKDLSLGFLRRAELVAAFLKPAELFLLDEPCVGLDELAKENFETLVKEEQRRGKTIILSSHNMGEIDSLAEHLLLMDKGEILFWGEKERLYRQLAPVNKMEVSFAKGLPDMQDIPFIRYEWENGSMKIQYNANHVTAAELVEIFLRSGQVSEITMEKPALEDIITESVKRRV